MASQLTRLRGLNRRYVAQDDFAVKTYRYLRIGMVMMVVALTGSVLYERHLVDCWQTSISAYYYTPVRAVFVGALMAIGASLIIVKGSTIWEDVFLNIAGILAPVVAVVPTSDAGRCWSIPPQSFPKDASGDLAVWVTHNIDNNVGALLFAGIAGLALATFISETEGARSTVRPLTRRLGLLVALAILVTGWALHRWWGAFDTRAHGLAAGLMFVFLALAIASNAVERRDRADKAVYRRIYATTAGLMVVAGVVILVLLRHWEHKVLGVEVIEITLFATFWAVQTKEHWNDTAGVVHPPGAGHPPTSASV